MTDTFADRARTALAEITKPETVGELTSEVVADDGVTTVTFAAAMAGYPGWHWTVSLAHLPGEEPTVLEAELMPGEGALLAPDWVPWSERLADWEAAQSALAEAESGVDDASAIADELDDDADDDDDDILGSDVLHGGDLDGVEIEDPDDDEGDEL
jgi:hypothetical protein